MGETKIKGSLMANYMKNLNTFLTSEWYSRTMKNLWVYTLGMYVGVIAVALGAWFILVGLFLVIIKPKSKEQQPGKNIMFSTSGKEAIGMSSNSLKLAPFLAHGAGCSHEKALNKNNENIMEGGEIIMAELIEFTVKARGKRKPKQINLPLEQIEKHNIQADEQFKVTLERIATPTKATQAETQTQPETTPAV